MVFLGFGLFVCLESFLQSPYLYVYLKAFVLFFSRSFIVSSLTLRSFIRFELTFVYDEQY